MPEVEKYWYNMKTGLVEKGLKSSSLYRIGPFDTEAEAACALEIVKDRTETWEEEEKADES